MNSEKMKKLLIVLRERFGYKKQNNFCISDSAELKSLLALASRHGVTWLIADTLLSRDSLPENLNMELVQASRESSLPALKKCADLLFIDRIAKEKHIVAFFYKGAALSALIFDHAVARKYSDIDILVNDYESASLLKKFLIENGFRSIDEINPDCSELKKKFHIEFQLVSPGGTGVDIHWKLFHDYYLSLEADTGGFVNNYPTVVKICGREIQTISPEDYCLVLSAHHLTHCWNELRLVCDIAGLIRRFPDIDYVSIFNQARKSGGARMLATSMHLAKLIFSMKLPEACERELKKDRLSRVIAILLCKRLQIGNSAVTRSEIMLFEIAARDSWKERLKFIWRAIVAPSDNDLRFVTLPVELQAFYYIIRPIRQLFTLVTRK